MQWKFGGQDVVHTGSWSQQMRVGRRLLEESNTGVPVQGHLGRRKLEERKEEMKVLFGKRLEGMEES